MSLGSGIILKVDPIGLLMDWLPYLTFLATFSKIRVIRFTRDEEIDPGGALT